MRGSCEVTPPMALRTLGGLSCPQGDKMAEFGRRRRLYGRCKKLDKNNAASDIPSHRPNMGIVRQGKASHLWSDPCFTGAGTALLIRRIILKFPSEFPCDVGCSAVI